MSSDLREAATKARRLANGSNLDAYRESLTDLGRAYLKAYPTAAALSVQGEPVAWQMPGTDSIITAELKAYRGVLAEQWTVPIYAAPAAPAVPPGWKLVPVDLTWEMTQAAIRCLNKPEPRVADIALAYLAMLAAAPSAPGADTRRDERQG